MPTHSGALPAFLASTRQYALVILTCRASHFTPFRFPLAFSLSTSDEAFAYPSGRAIRTPVLALLLLHLRPPSFTVQVFFTAG